MDCIKRFIILLTNSLLKNRGVNIGKNTKIYPNVSIQSSGKNSICIGQNCRIGSFARGYRIGPFIRTRLTTIGKNAKIEIGNACELNGVNICCRSLIQLGNDCQLASGVIITDTNGHLSYSFNRTKGIDSPKHIFVGNNVWIGLNSIILKGASIGDNSIVSAGSVVKDKFPPYSLISGNPAILVKHLDEEKFKNSCQ